MDVEPYGVAGDLTPTSRRGGTTAVQAERPSFTSLCLTELINDSFGRRTKILDSIGIHRILGLTIDDPQN